MHGWKRLLSPGGAAVVCILLLVGFLSSRSLHVSDFGLDDSARHVMDGYFFYDLVHDHPAHGLGPYTLHYFRQYPSIGFVFWPPLFAAVLGAFCLVGGPHVLTARACMMFFGAVFGVSFYALLRRRFPVLLSFAATAAAMTVPGIGWSFEDIMLELPTLAMMCLATLAYFHLTDRLQQKTSVWRGLLCAVACAAVVYTKQPAWFLYGALLADFVVNHRRFVRKAEVWIAIAGTCLLCLPLALFMVRFGHDNFAQSVGSNTATIMRGFESLPRWSIAAWTFYPKLALSSLNLVVVLLALAALILAAVRPHFARENALWLTWFALAYLTFSFYDNRSERNATFWWPAWVALAAACLYALMQRVPVRFARFAPVALLLWVPVQAEQDVHTDPVYLHGQQAAVATMFAGGSPGNILVFGRDQYMFVTLVREHDPQRRSYVLRGDKLLDAGYSLDEICRQFRVGTVAVEVPSDVDPAAATGLQSLRDGADFSPAGAANLDSAGTPYKLTLYRYLGPMDPAMAEVPLSNRILKP